MPIFGENWGTFAFFGQKVAKIQGQNWPSKDHDLTIAVLETTFANINQSKKMQNTESYCCYKLPIYTIFSMNFCKQNSSVLKNLDVPNLSKVKMRPSIL